MKNDIRYLVAVSAIICIYYNFNNTRTIIKRSFWNLSFALLVILISMKIRIKNEFLKFLNDHSYSIYLFQRLIFIIVQQKKLFINNNILRISFKFSFIFFIVSLFDKYTIFIDKYFKRTSFQLRQNSDKNIKRIYINNLGLVNSPNEEKNNFILFKVANSFKYIQEYGIIYNYNNNSITHLNTFINNCKDELINILSIYNYTKKSKEVEIVPFEIIFRWNGIIFPGLNKINFYLTIKLIKKLLSNKYVCYLNKLKLISFLDNITESKKSNAFNLL